MLTGAVLAFVNHLLAGEAWAMSRLRPFAGQTVRVRCPPFDASFRITDTGLLLRTPELEPDAAGDGITANVTLELPPEALWRLPIDRRAAFAAAKINGSAELAETLGFVLRNLSWDVEDDLSRIVGDIAAHRLVQGGKALSAWHSSATSNLARNFAEYFSEENPLVARKADVTAFVGEVDALMQKTAHLERRLARLVAVNRGK